MSKLDGKTTVGGYTLAFNVNTLCDLEETFEAKDVNEVLQVIQGLESNPSLRVIRKIFHTAFLQNHPDITLAETGTLISDVGIEAAVEALSVAVGMAFPDQSDAGEVGNVKKAPSKTGVGKKS